MKARVLILTALFALSAMLAAQVAQAQQTMLVNIPFDFVAGKVSLPAGQYTVTPMPADGVLLISQEGSRRTPVMLMTHATEVLRPVSDSKLVFHRYGTRYFLSQFWIIGTTRGRELPKFDAEEEAASIAKLQDQGQVAIMARVIPTHK